MTDAQVYDAARGWWRLNLTRAKRERYVVVVAQGVARQVIEINTWSYAPEIERYAFNGDILQPGHPVHDRYVGRELPSASQNPVHYFHDSSADSAGSPCRCGCGELARGTWIQGHDQRAIHQRIGQDFDGDIAKFIDWYDSDEVAAIRAA